MPENNFLSREDSALIIIDVQEKLFPYVLDQLNLQKKIEMLAKTAGLLKLPMILTEHYPKGLGRTIPAIANLINSAVKIEKTSFGCCGDNGFNDALKKSGKQKLIISGIEAHICVAQTAIGLKNKGFDVYLAADAISSRDRFDMQVAIERMRRQGIVVTTAEAVMYELMQDASDPLFKEFLKIVKE